MANCFELVPVDIVGSTSFVQSIAISDNRLFLGSSDGSIKMYDVQNGDRDIDSSSSSTRDVAAFSFVPHAHGHSIRDAVAGRGGHAVTSMRVIEKLQILMCVADSLVSVYDLQSGAHRCTLSESKGATMYSMHIDSGILSVASKRKLSFYRYNHVGGSGGGSGGNGFVSSSSALSSSDRSLPMFTHIGDTALSETPRMLIATSLGACIGLRRCFDMIEYASLNVTRILDCDREAKCVGTELPPTANRCAALLLGTGVQGRLVALPSSSAQKEKEAQDKDQLSNPSGSALSSSFGAEAGGVFGMSVSIVDVKTKVTIPRSDSSSSSTAGGGVLSAQNLTMRMLDKLEWNAVPICVSSVGPYIVTLLISDRVQTHDSSSLASLQEIPLHPRAPASALHTSLNLSSSVLAAFGGDVQTSDLSSRLLCVNFGREGTKPGTSPPVPPGSSRILSSVDKGRDKEDLPGVYIVALAAHARVPTVGSAAKSGSFASIANIGAALTNPFSARSTPMESSDDANMHVCRMASLHLQATRLASIGSYESAIAIVKEGNRDPRTKAHLSSTNLAAIQREYGWALHNRGDFDGSVNVFLEANVSIMDIISGYPDFVPAGLRAALLADGVDILPTSSASGGSTAKPLAGHILCRAAAAVAVFCLARRKALTTIRARAPSAGSQAGFDWAPVVLDTALIAALLACTSPRRSTVLEIVSNPNNCHVESCSVLLASQGPTYMEALLWLYRSNHEHRRVLAILARSAPFSTSPSSSTSSASTLSSGSAIPWSRTQYLTWVSQYLSFLWTDGDVQVANNSLTMPSKASLLGVASPSSLVLPNVRPLLECDGRLGLSVLCSSNRRMGSGLPSALSLTSAPLPLARQTSGTKTSTAVGASVSSASAGAVGIGIELGQKFEDFFTGKGVTSTDVVTFLQGVKPNSQEESETPCTNVEKLLLFNICSAIPGYNTLNNTRVNKTFIDALALAADSQLKTHSVRLPLISGQALALSYLEWLLLQSAHNLQTDTSNRSISILTGGQGQGQGQLSKGVDKDGSTSGSGSGSDELRRLADLYVSMMLSVLKSLEKELDAEESDELKFSKTHTQNTILQNTDTVTGCVYKIHRAHLQHFLTVTRAYDASKALQLLPSDYLQECALIFGRLGRHRDAIGVYTKRLSAVELALGYCDMVWDKFVESSGVRVSAGFGEDATGDVERDSISLSLSLAQSVGSGSLSGSAVCEVERERDVYLYLLEAVLADPNSSSSSSSSSTSTSTVSSSTTTGPDSSTSSSSSSSAVSPSVALAIKLATTLYDKLDPCHFLALLPGSTPAKLLEQYLSLYVEWATSQRHNLMVVHQLMRVREVAVLAGIVDTQMQVTSMDIGEGRERDRERDRRRDKHRGRRPSHGH